MLVPGVLPAATFGVGADPACTHGSIQAAIDAAAVDPDYDAIRVARTATYVGAALLVPATALVISGGHADCAAPASDGERTLISGVGNGGLPVLRIEALGGATQAQVALHGLELVGSGQSVADGGVLQVRGWVQLSAGGVVLRDGLALRGGGL